MGKKYTQKWIAHADVDVAYLVKYLFSVNGAHNSQIDYGQFIT